MKKSKHWRSICIIIGMVVAQATMAGARDRYVVKNNPGAAAPYESWDTAAGDIQTAVNAAAEGEPVWVRSAARWSFLAQRSYRSAGDTVWVRAGVYDAGGKSDVTWRSKLTNRVAIAKSVVVRSEHNDPANTIIKGAWSTDGRTNGPGAVRCVYLADGASLFGFTLAGGATLTTNEAWADNSDWSGGGVYAQSSMAVISNCIITGNSAFGDPRGSARGGAGACGGKFYNCVFTSNTTPFSGGGADHSVMFDCVVAGNSAGGNGGGVNGSALYGCVVSNNYSGASGGGAFGGPLHGCALVNNRAAGHGGGAASSDGSPLVALSECVVARNYAGGVGGGVRMGKLLNCLVCNNAAGGGNPGVHQSFASNSVFVANAVSSYGLNNCLFVGSPAWGDADAKFYNCTAVGASGRGFAGAISLHNCISWSNSVADSGAIKAFNSCGAGSIYTNTILGNTTNHPMFVDYGAGNYRLQADSPCVNAGFKREWMIAPAGWAGYSNVIPCIR